MESGVHTWPLGQEMAGQHVGCWEEIVTHASVSKHKRPPRQKFADLGGGVGDGRAFVWDHSQDLPQLCDSAIPQS